MSKENRSAKSLFCSPEFEAGRQHRRTITEVGQLLKSVRKHMQLTQIEVAERSGLSQPEISRLENGTAHNGPELGTIIRYIDACGDSMVLCSLSLKPRISVSFGTKSVNVERPTRPLPRNINVA